MSDINDSFKIYSQLLAQKLKPAIDASINMNEILYKSLEPVRLALDNFNFSIKEHIEQQHAILSNISNKLYSEQLKSAINTMEYIQKAYQYKIDIPELKYTEIVNSFNEFVDDVNSANIEVELKKEDINVEIPNFSSTPSTLSWDQRFMIILGILSFLVSFASYLNSLDNHYQEEYFKTLREINSNLEEIKSFESHK